MRQLVLALLLASSSAIASDYTHRFEKGVVSMGDSGSAVIAKAGRRPDRIVTQENDRGAAIGERWEYVERDKQVTFYLTDGKVTSIEEVR